ncbi:MAG: hypothetical protein V1843_00105 [bacterium]
MQKSSYFLMGGLIIFGVIFLFVIYSIDIEDPKGYIPPSRTGAPGAVMKPLPTVTSVDKGSGSVIITKTPKKAPVTKKAAQTLTSGQNLALIRDPFYSIRRASGQSGDTGIIPDMPDIPDFTGDIPEYLTLQGVWISGSSRSAFINDQTVQEGGSVDGWKVIRITQESVSLMRAGQKKILKVGE